MVIFGTIKAKNGLPILAVLDLRPSENHFIIDDLQKVSSAYTKDGDAVSFVRSSDVLYAEKKRATSVLRSIGFHMPIELNESGFIGSISYKGRSVNIFGKKFSNIFSESQTQYSERDPELTAQRDKVNEVLERENERLREDNQYLKELVKLQRKVTHGTKFTKSSVELVASRLMKYTSAKGNRAELVKLLNEFYGYIPPAITVDMKENDGVAPVINYVGDDTVNTNEGVVFSLDATAYDAQEDRNVTIEYVWADESVVLEDGSLKIGTHELVLRAVDYYGNVSEKALTVVVAESEKEDSDEQSSASSVTLENSAQSSESKTANGGGLLNCNSTIGGVAILPLLSVGVLLMKKKENE